MPFVQRSSDVVEDCSEKVLWFGMGGLGALLLGAVCIYYQGMLTLFGYLIATGGVTAMVYAAFCGLQIRKVASFDLICPYCDLRNVLAAAPGQDFSCTGCHRMIHLRDGVVMTVFQVRCGYCNRLNHYVETSDGLICEECDREIPISTASGELSSKAFRTYTQKDDDQLYELLLTGQGHERCEELISCLQHMLALNRNQVKQMLAEVPVTLLTGIPRKKAEMLAAQLKMHDGQVEFRTVQA